MVSYWWRHARLMLKKLAKNLCFGARHQRTPKKKARARLADCPVARDCCGTLKKGCLEAGLILVQMECVCSNVCCEVHCYFVIVSPSERWLISTRCRCHYRSHYRCHWRWFAVWTSFGKARIFRAARKTERGQFGRTWKL